MHKRIFTWLIVLLVGGLLLPTTPALASSKPPDDGVIVVDGMIRPHHDHVVVLALGVAQEEVLRLGARQFGYESFGLLHGEHGGVVVALEGDLVGPQEFVEVHGG